MNKIILLSDKEQLPKGAFDFACMMNEQQPILLTGIFLPTVDYLHALTSFSYASEVAWLYEVPQDEGQVAVANGAITEFQRLCRQNGIEYRIHEKKYENIQQEIKTESRFADLLLFSNERFYKSLNGEAYDEYTNHTLHHAECPVMVVPETFRKPDNIILAYDGSASSVYAIRQFATLMPALTRLETVLVYIDPDGQKDFPDKDYLQELAAQHYPNLTFLKLDIDPKKYFGTWLANRKNTVLVTGAQGRSGLSQLFRTSFAGDALQEHRLPVFIAHR